MNHQQILARLHAGDLALCALDVYGLVEFESDGANAKLSAFESLAKKGLVIPIKFTEANPNFPEGVEREGFMLTPVRKQKPATKRQKAEAANTATSAMPQPTPVTRNPDWTRDELIIALDLYLQHRPSPPGKDSKEVLAVSDLLNRIGTKLHGAVGKETTYRNANGVYMKLMNFRRFDPDYTGSGKKGLTAGNKDEEVVWDLYAADPKRCHEIVQAIIRNIDAGEAAAPVGDEQDDFLEEAPEGRLLTRVHLRRERNAKLVQSKKQQVLKKGGALQCEVCGFDFKVEYGERGEGFIECHHTNPLETLEAEGKTHVRDLALVSSNCHRMIHRRRPWLTIGALREFVPRT